MDIAPLAFGMSGSLTINAGSGAKDGQWNAIQMIEDTQFTALTEAKADPSGVDLTILTFPAGLVIYGNFTSATVASGTARCYNAANNRG